MCREGKTTLENSVKSILSGILLNFKVSVFAFRCSSCFCFFFFGYIVKNSYKVLALYTLYYIFFCWYSNYLEWRYGCPVLVTFVDFRSLFLFSLAFSFFSVFCSNRFYFCFGSFNQKTSINFPAIFQSLWVEILVIRFLYVFLLHRRLFDTIFTMWKVFNIHGIVCVVCSVYCTGLCIAFAKRNVQIDFRSSSTFNIRICVMCMMCSCPKPRLPIAVPVHCKLHHKYNESE